MASAFLRAWPATLRTVAPFVLLALLKGPSAVASSAVQGTEYLHDAGAGTRERCVALARMPDGAYSAQDGEEEAALCGIDFYRGTHALCPKVFSTSPGTLVYELAGGASENRVKEFESAQCGQGGIDKPGARGAPVSYKMSVNTRATSATFANAALVYYHFSRYFGASVHVPVAVLRTMERQEHERRVTDRGLALSAGRPALKMNHAAWQALRDAERNPASYSPTEELFTPEGQIYGAMLRPAGKRYSEEINGTRASGWGDGQNRDFQKTAPFRALRSPQPLLAAIEEGKHGAMQDPRLAKAMGKDATPLQMAYWMSDLIDITLLDFLFSQQDRVGNVDYVAYWYWTQDGKPMRRAASAGGVPPDIAAHEPVLLERTELADNDAGLRLSYMNYAKRTGMLDGLRHYRSSVYERLLRLQRDFAARGPLHEQVRTSFGLSEGEFRQVVDNTAAAARILHAACSAGALRFDVEPEELLVSGRVTERKVACGELQ